MNPFVRLRDIAPASFQTPLDWSRAASVAPFVAAGLAAFAVGLIATLPADVVLKNRAGGLHAASGTVWNGVALAGDGLSVRWRVDPLRSVSSMSLAAKVEVIGADTHLTGRVRMRGATTTIEGLKGAVSWQSVRSFTSGLPFDCVMTGDLDLRRLILGGGHDQIEGRLFTDPGRCKAKFDVGDTPAPPLLLQSTTGGGDSRLRLVPAGDRGRTLAELVLTPAGKLIFAPTAAGEAMFPSILRQGATVETTL